MAGVDNRQVKLSRGRFLGGSSGCNGTLCIRGNKQDYDDWGLEGWSGDEFFDSMRKVRPVQNEILTKKSLTMSSQRHFTPRDGSKPTKRAMAIPALYIPNRTT